MIHDKMLTIEKITRRIQTIEPLVYSSRLTIEDYKYFEHKTTQDDPLIGTKVNDKNWKPLKSGKTWGDWKAIFTMRSSFVVPKGFSDKGPVALYLPLGNANNFCHPEALVHIDAKPIAARDCFHDEVILPAEYCDGKKHTLALYGWTGGANYRPTADNFNAVMSPSEIVIIDQPTRNFIITARVALGAAKVLNENCPARGIIIEALDDAFKLIDLREPFGEDFYKSIPKAHKLLKKAIEKAGPALEVEIIAVGHSHIDVVWLWTLAQTRLKCGRSFHTVTKLMEQFKEYHFTQSQPQLYDFVRQDYPQLFETIKEYIAKGQWEPTGGMWVEADCNITGAESLVRQFLLGREFFARHFGKKAESPILWLPDVFGYAHNLPQLMKQAELEYFYTTKICWNQYNRLPYDSFWWQGLDGTKVLTYFGSTKIPNGWQTSTYNGQATPEEILTTWTNSLHKGNQRNLMTAFGHGDGGGGPTREMIENLIEMKDFPAMPKVTQSKAIDFFRKLEKDAGDKLPTWAAELYLEYHRGTYTTQAKNKRANRKCEFGLHDVEFLASAASLLDNKFQYPHEKLNDCWQLVCLNQFHDTIPGSSISEVYVESLEQYQQVHDNINQLKETSLSAIASKSNADILIVNPTSFKRSDLAFYPGELKQNQVIQRPDGTILPTQQSGKDTLIDVGTLAPYSINTFKITDSSRSDCRTNLKVSESLLENDLLKVKFNKKGDIVKIFDKVNKRDVLTSKGIANQFQAFEDRPLENDAWDVDIFFEDKMWLSEPATSIKVVESGPIRASIEIKRKILNSEYSQIISLNHNSSRLDFETDIDWKEKHILLKSAFEVDIFSPNATYEIQWGNVERPTHRSTSWDWAKFEVCAQKWVDLSENDYGVSLLNDCKYGHDIKDNLMRISLLRSPTNPDPHADQGKHKFKYSLLAHEGKWSLDTVAQAYSLNDPMIVYKPEKKSASADKCKINCSVVTTDSDNIVIETIKQAQDGNGLIVRLYENFRQRGLVTINTGFGLKKVYKTNLLENNKEELSAKNDSVKLYIKPYEIVSLRLIPS